MISKILSITLLVTCTQALQYDGHQGAISSISLNEHHNTIHHIQSVPTLVKTIATPVHAAPVHAAPLAFNVATPVYAAPHSQASSYSSFSPLGHGGAPAIHYASPVSSLSLSQHAISPVHYAAPVAKVAAPVLLRTVSPAHHGSSYSSFSTGQSASAAPHFAAAPFTKVLAPLSLPAASIGHAAPAVHVAPATHASAHYDEYAHPKYEFAYGVEDHHTGDIHSHKEVRDGDLTQGEYSLHEADGTVRTVKYVVDKHSGFNAIVERSGHATHAQPAPVAKAIVAAPVIAKAVVAAPSYHH